jgi:hypothetical protein
MIMTENNPERDKIKNGGYNEVFKNFGIDIKHPRA